MITLVVTVALEILAAVLVALWLGRSKRDQRHALRWVNLRTETGQGGAIGGQTNKRDVPRDERSSPTKTRAGVIYSARNPTSRYARLMRGLLEGPER
jgi:hypothetical protein